MTDPSCPIHTGAYLLWERDCSLDYPPIFYEFREVNMESLIDFEAKVFESPVQEFHHSFNFARGENLLYLEDPDKPISFVLNNRHYDVDTDEFSLLMNFLPSPDGIKFYTNSSEFTDEVFDQVGITRDALFQAIVKPWCIPVCTRSKLIEVEQLKDEVKMHYRIIRENLTCRPMGTRVPGLPSPSTVMVIEALMIFWIKQRTKVDMGFLIANIIQDVSIGHSRRPLPYGMRLTGLFNTLEILTPDDGEGVSVPRIPLV